MAGGGLSVGTRRRGAVAAALLIVTFLARRLGLSAKLGTLIAVGTSICGATAIVATTATTTVIARRRLLREADMACTSIAS